MYYIGFDVGGTKCAVSLGKWDGNEIELIARKETETLADPYETLGALAPFVKEWLKNYTVIKAGISCGGPLNLQRGMIGAVPNLSKKWDGFEIVSYVKDNFGLNANLKNDADASAVAEWKFGAGRGARNLVFMTFGTGLGAGLILDGKLYSGTNGNAGEIGHVRLAQSGPVGCNKVGSAEGFCSGSGITKLAHLRAQEQDKLIQKDITTKIIFEKAKQGDEFYLSVVRESAEKFATVISILIDLLNPEIIVAGGVFMRNYDFFMEILAPIVQSEALASSYKECKILPAQIGENIGDYAALSVAILED